MSDVWCHRGDASERVPATQGGGTGDTGHVGPPSSSSSSSSSSTFNALVSADLLAPSNSPSAVSTQRGPGEALSGGRTTGRGGAADPLQLLEFDVDGAGEFDAEAVRQTLR